MTQKEKAIDLVNKFGKELAKICVKEILDACNQVYDSDMVHFRETGTGEWWLSVTAEIEKL